MTIKEAAAELDLLPATVCAYLRAKDPNGLKGTKVKGKWVVNGPSVRKFRTARIKQGK